VGIAKLHQHRSFRVACVAPHYVDCPQLVGSTSAWSHGFSTIFGDRRDD
jgi:hypothetical protein